MHDLAQPIDLQVRIRTTDDHKKRGQTNIAARVLHNMGQEVVDDVFKQLWMLTSYCHCYFIILLIRS